MAYRGAPLIQNVILFFSFEVAIESEQLAEITFYIGGASKYAVAVISYFLKTGDLDSNAWQPICSSRASINYSCKWADLTRQPGL